MQLRGATAMLDAANGAISITQIPTAPGCFHWYHLKFNALHGLNMNCPYRFVV